MPQRALSRPWRPLVLLPLLAVLALTLTLESAPSNATPDPGDRSKNMTAASYQEEDTARAPYSRRDTGWGNYTTPADDGWTWNGQKNAWDIYGFTADDKPLELLNQSRTKISRR